MAGSASSSTKPAGFGTASERGMLHLSFDHPIIRNALAELMLGEMPRRGQALDVKACDFDGFHYWVYVDEELPECLNFSVRMYSIQDALDAGSQRVIGELFVGMQTPEPLSWEGTGYDLTLQLNLDTDLPETEEARVELVDNLAMIKRHLFGAPLSLCFHAVETGGAFPDRIQLQFRPNEYMFILPDKQKVTVIFALDLADPIDVQISRVFLMEFGEARKGSAAGAPTCTYDKPDAPPAPIRDVKMDVNVGFITFSLEPRHFAKGKHDNAVNLISGFRSYLYYHIKCSKSDMHTRMRRRVESLLQVLNRAKPDHLLYGDKGTKRKPGAGKLR